MPSQGGALVNRRYIADSITALLFPGRRPTGIPEHQTPSSTRTCRVDRPLAPAGAARPGAAGTGRADLRPGRVREDDSALTMAGPLPAAQRLAAAG